MKIDSSLILKPGAKLEVRLITKDEFDKYPIPKKRHFDAKKFRKMLEQVITI